MELLQLRRDLVVRADSVIEKNQALILSAPNLLPRLMELLRVMNYNRPLAVFGEGHGKKEARHQTGQRVVGVCRLLSRALLLWPLVVLLREFGGRWVEDRSDTQRRTRVGNGVRCDGRGPRVCIAGVPADRNRREKPTC